MPYLLQDNWSRANEEGTIKTITMQNKNVLVIVYPDFGGKIGALKVNGVNLVFDNPVFQPSDLAIRKVRFNV